MSDKLDAGKLDAGKLVSMSPKVAGRLEDEAAFAAVREAKRRAALKGHNTEGKTPEERLNRKRNAKKQDRKLVRAWKAAHPDGDPAPRRAGLGTEPT